LQRLKNPFNSDGRYMEDRTSKLCMVLREFIHTSSLIRDVEEKIFWFQGTV